MLQIWVCFPNQLQGCGFIEVSERGSAKTVSAIDVRIGIDEVESILNFRVGLSFDSQQWIVNRG